MNDVRFPETRQDHPRKVAVGDHGITGLPSELVVPGAQSRIENERWKSDHAYAHAAQARFGVGHQGNPGSATDDVCADGERTSFVSGAHQCAGGDCEGMEVVTEVRSKKILGHYFV